MQNVWRVATYNRGMTDATVNMRDLDLAPLDAVQGQAVAIGALRNAVEAGRLHHAYIFHGPQGVGKFTSALALGHAILGVTNKVVTDELAVDKANDETRLDTGHPDLHVVTKELARYSREASIRQRKLTQIPVEVLREALIEPVYRAAMGRRGKVFIVDEAELLNATGQNALLKTLEEPPPNTFIILVTASEDRLLPTIRSRCQRIGFTPLPDEIVAAHVAKLAPDLSEVDRTWVLGFANGSMGRAQLAITRGLVTWARSVLPALDGAANGRSVGDLGTVMHTHIDTFAKTFVEEHANASKEAANRQAANLMWAMVMDHARRRVATLAGENWEAMTASSGGVEAWLGVIDAAEHGRQLAMTNVNLSLVCDHFAVHADRVLRGLAV